MMREQRGVLLAFGRLLLLEHPRDRGVGDAAALGELRAVGDFLRERMLERVDDLGEERLLVDEIAQP